MMQGQRTIEIVREGKRKNDKLSGAGIDSGGGGRVEIAGNNDRWVKGRANGRGGMKRQ